MTEQVRVALSPATMGEEGEEVRETRAGSVDVWNYKNINSASMHINMYNSCTYYDSCICMCVI